MRRNEADVCVWGRGVISSPNLSYHISPASVGKTLVLKLPFSQAFMIIQSEFVLCCSNSKSYSVLYFIPPIRSHLFGSRSVNVINEIRCKPKSYSNSFYPDSIRCWNKIGPELRNSPNLKSLMLGILALVRPPPKRIFDIHDPIGLKWHFQLRVGLSSLLIKRIIILMIPFVISVTSINARKISKTFFSTAYVLQKLDALLNSVLTLNFNFNQLNPQNKIQLLLYGDTSFSDAINKLLLINPKISERL